MKVGRFSADSSARQVLSNEGRVLAQLSHPNLPTLLDFGSIPDGRAFLVTEWLDGLDLRRLLQSNALVAIKDLLLIVLSVSRAIAFVHNHGILHLDVKPANILVPIREGRSQFNQVKLIDFSVRGLLQAETGTTLSGTVAGTPYYMSPEQAKGGVLSPAADVFPLGVVIYEMISGRRPFEAENPADMFLALLSKEPPPLDEKIAEPIRKLVLKCLEKEPSKRPWPAELVRLLQALLDDSSLSDTSLRPWPTSAEPAEATGHSDLFRTQHIGNPQPSLRAKIAAIAGATSIMLLGLGLAVEIYSRDETSTAPRSQWVIHRIRCIPGCCWPATRGWCSPLFCTQTTAVHRRCFCAARQRSNAKSVIDDPITSNGRSSQQVSA